MPKMFATIAQLAGFVVTMIGLYIVLELGWFLLTAGLATLAAGTLGEVVAMKKDAPPKLRQVGGK